MTYAARKIKINLELESVGAVGQPGRQLSIMQCSDGSARGKCRLRNRSSGLSLTKYTRDGDKPQNIYIYLGVSTTWVLHVTMLKY